MKTIAILLLGLAGCALSNTIPPTEDDVGFFVQGDKHRESLEIAGNIHLVNGKTLEIREFKYDAGELIEKFVPVKFVGEKKDGAKVDLTFKGEDDFGGEQQLSDTRKANSEVLLNLGNASARDFAKILIETVNDEADVLATAELNFPTATKPVTTTTVKPKVTTKSTTKKSNRTITPTTAPTTHGSSGSSTSQAGMLCLVVAVIAVLGH